MSDFTFVHTADLHLDPLDGWAHSLVMPASVHSFGPELDSVVFEKDGIPLARIHGISYPTRTIGKRFGNGFARSGDEPFQIGLFHCNAGDNTQHAPYAPRTVKELTDAKLDYWALGHVHESIVLRKSDPFIGYPGNTQGRHIKEAGPRGCFVVRVAADGKLKGHPQFVPTDAVRWLAGEVDLTGLDTIDSLLSRIDQTLDGLAATAR
jgi:DNA repair exonuclease SbcCD nuclease subunit